MVSRHVQSQVFIGIFVLLLLSACKQYSANVEDFFQLLERKRPLLPADEQPHVGIDYTLTQTASGMLMLQ